MNNYRLAMQNNPRSLNITNSTINTKNVKFVGGAFHYESQQVLRESKSHKVKNTKRAYDPKILEFRQFCDSIYGNDYLAQIVTEEKNFAFLFYQAHRVKKQTKSQRSCTDSGVSRFDHNDYDEVTKQIRQSYEKTDDCPMGDVLGFNMVNQYRCAIKRILREQRDNNANTLKNEDIDSERVTRLMENVKKRKDAVARANFKERFDGEFTPYKMISEVNQIE